MLAKPNWQLDHGHLAFMDSGDSHVQGLREELCKAEQNHSPCLSY